MGASRTGQSAAVAKTYRKEFLCKFFSARIILRHFCFALFWLQTPRALWKFLTNHQTPISFMLLDAGNPDSSLRALSRL